MAESQRMKLEIVEVKERLPVGDKGAVKLAFKAKVDGKELWFFTFSSRLFETIEGSKGKTIEADVAVSAREYDGNTYIDRKVTQVYVDGQPIGGQRQGQWQARQDSPEKIASIESQKRADIIAQLWMADKLKVTSSQVDKLLVWLDELGTRAPKAPANLEQAEKDVKDLWPGDDVPPAEQAPNPPEQAEAAEPLVNNLGQLFQACKDRYKMTMRDVLTELNVSAKEEIADVQEAWQRIKSVRDKP